MMEMVYGDALARNARKYPNKLAVACEEKRRTYREFNLRVNRLANSLLKIGINRNDHIATLSLNSVELMEAYFANLKLGAVTVPLNARYLASECLKYMELTDSTVLVFHEDFMDLVLSIKDKLSSVKAFISIGDRVPSFAHSYESLIEEGHEDEPGIEVLERDPAFIISTGGTTGFPKGAIWTHRTCLWNTINVMTENQSPTPDDVIVYPLPLYHGAALSRFLAYMYAGGTFIVMKEFDPAKCLDIIEREKVTAITGNPTIWAALIEEKERRHRDTSSMRMWLSSMGFMHPQMKERISSFLFPNARTFVSYALTEASPGVTVLKPEDNPRESGCCGRPYISCEVRIVDENDNDLPPGEVGEILVRGPNVVDGYYKNPEETERTFRGGWLHTGDLGKLDDLGFLYMVDRIKDMIKSGGINIYSQEVEEVLSLHPKIQEAVVIGVPHERWGETVKAIVVPKKGEVVTEEEIIEHCRRHLASYKKPTSVAFVDELPKSPLGKVLKKELRARFVQ